MQKAINRFWDWLFHPSIRWYHYPKGKAAWFRYPSPGSNIKQQKVEDYKTPYESTNLNIRYNKPIRSVTHQPDSYYVAEGPGGMSTIDKLRTFGFLKTGQNSEQQVEKAKQKFQQKYGYSVEKKSTSFNNKVFRDDLGLKGTLPQGTNRQSYRMFVENSFKAAREDKEYFNMPNSNRRFIKEPEAVWLESLDMYSHAHFQQTRIDVNYKLDKHAQENAERGYIEIRKGEKSFWKALDDSNDAKNVEKVQKAIGDDKPTDFTLRDTKIEFERNAKGEVVDVHPKTKGL